MTDEETYTKGMFSLTEWEDVNYCEHYFCKGDYELSDREVVDLLNKQHEQIGALQRHIERSTFNKIRVEDVFNCAKYDRFYDNEEAIKSIDWIAEQLGVDFE